MDAPERGQVTDDPYKWYRELRERFADVDVATLDDAAWQDWLSCHNVFERDVGRGRRAAHRHALRLAASNKLR